jgi:iron(II)-dependent oxidoreductase
MVIQHEHQHDETMLATIQLSERPFDVVVRAATRTESSSRLPSASGSLGPEVSLPGGVFVMGTDSEPWAYDNERPAHEVEVAPFRIDRAPVSNGDFVTFIADGGYDDPLLWTEDGWKWRQEAALEHPMAWQREGADAWSVLRFGHRRDVDASEPVQHVCWYEADAFARWAGKRLPTEMEWEYAASWAPDARKRRYPWGDDDPTDAHANLGQRRLGPTSIGSHALGASAWGCVDMVGGVWEWTSSDFHAYPGFRSFPYPEYSEVFHGAEYKVLRGGSWAVHPVACRTTFRNWDYPIRRQIFAGFRCARDA